MKKKRTVLSSMFARIVAFFILAISFAVSVGGGVLTLMLWEADAYTQGVTPVLKEIMASQVVWDDVNYVKVLYQENDMLGLEAYLDRRNASMEIYNCAVQEGEEMELLWSNYNGFETKYSFNCFTELRVEIQENPEVDITSETDTGEESEYHFQDTIETMDAEDYGVEEEVEANYLPAEKVYEYQETLFRVYVDDTFPYEDEYKAIHAWGTVFEDLLYVIPIAAVICLFLCLSSFIFLMCSAGHHQWVDGITGGILYFFHFDIVTVVFGFVAFVLIIFMVELTSYGGFGECVIALILLAVEIVWCTIYCMELAVELKKGTIFKHTLIYTVLRKCGRGVKALCGALVSLFRGLPLITGVCVAYGIFSVVQFVMLIFFCSLWSMDADVLVLCLLEKVILFPVVLYFALVCKKLQQGSEALAEGNLTYKLDTSKMILGFKEHGENLNSIGEGIAVAVEDRMRSEHLKTELITNVSHDLKTPLTSIINYADLIGTEVAKTEGIDTDEKEQLAEYAAVLLRQSKRLKKLLEDLVEASKATTGNLEVNLVPCEVGVILSQAIGEYAQRFAEKELEFIVKQPEEPVSIQADGRHLWRVFDNLMNNICKYAQEGTRVYLTVDTKEETVEIVFRNMSKYALDISAEELQERFVRGDKSRHMEGNGLGLSIAGSLVELQNGKMEIVIDGDLFKVTLRFPVI
uniref:sensor histidine kinase n=1 Tax=Acetatifactor sp. TaxID=1872090 RepID=UPI004055B888